MLFLHNEEHAFARLVDLDEEQVEDALRTDEDTTAVHVTRQPTVLFLGERGELRRIPRADVLRAPR